MRTLVITGAGGGLGKVTVERFAKEGYQVFACDTDEDTIDRLKSARSVAWADVVDVSDRQQVERFFATVRTKVDCMDVLINNVGVPGPRAPLEEVEPEDWSKTLDANLNAAYWTSRQVLGAMKHRMSGCILNVSTVSVRTLPVHRSPYIVSKAALESLTVAIAREAGPYNVRCNAVRPGLMNNDRLNRILSQIAEQKMVTIESVEAEQLQYVSMRSKVAMEEVAAMLAFLASDAAAHVTGQIICVDGGVQWEG